MKNRLLSIFQIAILIISILSFSSCSNTTNDVNKNLEINFLTICDASEKDFMRYNNAFAGQEIDFIIDNYRLMKVTCEILNSNDCAINIQGVNQINNNDFYIYSNCIDFEPTYPISAKSLLDVDLYIYVNNNLTNEDKIIKNLNELNILFSVLKAD